MYRGVGLNLYAYCDNNPIVYFGPSGYFPCPTKQALYKKYRVEGLTAAEANHAANIYLIERNKGTAAVEAYTKANNIANNIKVIEFGINADTASKHSEAELRAFANHLAEQNIKLNDLSINDTSGLQSNLDKFHNSSPKDKNLLNRKINAERRRADRELGGTPGDKLSAAHSLDSVAGAYINAFLGLRNEYANLQVGTIWKDSWSEISPGEFNRLVPGIKTDTGFVPLEDYLNNRRKE